MMDSDTISDVNDAPPASSSDAAPSWAVSVCFWATLLLAVTVYAAVALAPKFCVWNQVRLEYRHYATELIALEDDVTYLERVEAALRTDPEFRNRVAGVAQPLEPDGEEFIPVSGSLLFGHQDSSANRSTTPSLPKYHAAAVLIASHTRLRLMLLCSASLLTIFAFTFLNEAGAGFVYMTGTVLKSAVTIPLSRYFAALPDDPEQAQ